MNLKKLADRAKQALDERGGTEGVKQDVNRAREAASKPGSIRDKALAAGQALTRRQESEKPGEAERDRAETSAPAAAPAAASSEGSSPPPMPPTGS